MLRQMNVKDDYNDAQTTQKNRRYMHGMMYLLLFLFCLGFYIVNMIINAIDHPIRYASTNFHVADVTPTI